MNNNWYLHRKSRARGQGLVEYAIIIALVALASIVVLAFVSMAINRDFGILCGVFQCRRQHDDGKTVLWFDTSFAGAPVCSFYPRDADSPGASNQTMLYAPFYSSFPISQLSAADERGDALAISEVDSVRLGTGAQENGKTYEGTVNRYAVTIMYGDGDLRAQCPKSIVVQTVPAAGNITIVAPVTAATW
jgi:hypothetical protein